MKRKHNSLIKDSNVAEHVAYAQKSSMDIATHYDKQRKASKGISNTLRRHRLNKEVATWHGIANRSAERAERILLVDTREVAEKLSALFTDKVPGFDKDEGVWPYEGSDTLKLTWKTDTESGRRTIESSRYDYIEPGMGYRRTVTWTGDDGLPEVYTAFESSTREGYSSTHPHKLSDTKQLDIKQEMVTTYNTWVNVLNHPGEHYSKYLAQQPEVV